MVSIWLLFLLDILLHNFGQLCLRVRLAKEARVVALVVYPGWEVIEEHSPIHASLGTQIGIDLPGIRAYSDDGYPFTYVLPIRFRGADILCCC